MTKVLAGITTSVDGYVAGPDDRPGKGLGEGGERLHYWVFGGPWTYDAEPSGQATGEDAAWLQEAMAVSGRSSPAGRPSRRQTAGAAENPWDIPLFVVTHRPRRSRRGAGVHVRVRRASRPSSEPRRCRREGRPRHGRRRRDRQALEADLVDELSIIVAPVILGGGSACSRASRRTWSWNISACASPST